MEKKPGFFSALKDKVVRGLSPARPRQKAHHQRAHSMSNLPDPLISRSGSLRPVGEALMPLIEGPDGDDDINGELRREGWGQWVREQLSRLPSSNGVDLSSGPRSLLLSAYVAAGAVVGPLLPIAYILHRVIEGDKEGIMEGVTFTCQFSLPMRVFVPVFYNGLRMFAIADWLRNEIAKAEEDEHGSAMLVHVRRGLTVINLVFWKFLGVFGFF